MIAFLCLLPLRPSSLPRETGVAAPILVPGAIKRKLAALAMIAPALVADAPVGLTHTTMGTELSPNNERIFLVVLTNPPGVFKVMTNSFAPSSAATLKELSR